jgi:hypothetical protein
MDVLWAGAQLRGRALAQRAQDSEFHTRHHTSPKDAPKEVSIIKCVLCALHVTSITGCRKRRRRLHTKGCEVGWLGL